MLPKVSAQNYERCYFSRLKKLFQSDINYKDYSFYVPETKRAIVGNIPSEIINLFEPDKRETNIKIFQSVLAETAKLSREENDITKVNKFLATGLRDIMPKGTNVDFKYVGYGGYKDVYKLSIKDVENKKIMHDKAFHVYKINNASMARKSHGLYAEPNAWYYLQRNIGHSTDKTQFTKHYISDMQSGYSLTEFADNEITKTTAEFDHNRILGVILTDTQNNPRINKKVYDIGGLIRIQGAIKDRTTLKYFKKIANRNTQKEREEVVKNLTEKVENIKTPHRDKIIEALDYYKGLPPWYWSRTSENIPIRMIW